MEDKPHDAVHRSSRVSDLQHKWSRGRRAGVLVAFLALLVAAAFYTRPRYSAEPSALQAPEPRAHAGAFYPSDSQRQSLSIQPVEQQAFRLELVADGKIAIDEDHSTPIFSPYSGRVARIAAKPGDSVKSGQLLLTLEATDMVQAQNDFITAVAGVETARSQLNLAEITEKRQHDLFDAKAVPLKDWQQAQADLISAQSNARSADIALEAVRNRLRLLQKTEDEIANFQKTGKINPETPIYAPIGGSVVQRKVGPGQFITSGGSDPSGDSIFVIGDLATVWLVANIKQSDAARVQVGQALEFRVSAIPGRVFSGKIDYVAETLDTTTRRLLVRATIGNPEKLLKLEMFASVTVFAGDDQLSPAVPRESIIYEGSDARVWIAIDDSMLERRKITLGLTSGNLVQVVKGLEPGDKVVTKGALFIDRAAAAND
jgi:cobalt-zinc-cadmium efflux system membrane fusion protein